MIEPRMKRINVGDAFLKYVNELCYLSDLIDAVGGAEASSIMRVKCGWKKFRELLPLLIMNGLSLHTV